MGLVRDLLDVLLPTPCAACGELAGDGRLVRLCAACEALLPRQEWPARGTWRHIRAWPETWCATASTVCARSCWPSSPGSLRGPLSDACPQRMRWSPCRRRSGAAWLGDFLPPVCSRMPCRLSSRFPTCEPWRGGADAARSAFRTRSGGETWLGPCAWRASCRVNPGCCWWTMS